MNRLFCALLLIGVVPTMALAVVDATTPGMPAATRGDFPIVQSISLAGDDYCVGVGFDGANIWVSAGDTGTGSCHYYIYEQGGSQVGSYPQAGGASGWGNRDLTYDGTYMFGSFSSAVNGTNAATYTYAGSFYGPINPCRALTFDGTYFYTGGFSMMLYRMQWNGTWGSTATSTPLSGPHSGTYGLAYDDMENCLWMSTADYTGDIYKLDMNGNILDIYTSLPEYDIAGGCEMACLDEWGYCLLMLQQYTPDMVTVYDLGHGPCGPSATTTSSIGGVKALYK